MRSYQFVLQGLLYIYNSKDTKMQRLMTCPLTFAQSMLAVASSHIIVVLDEHCSMGVKQLDLIHLIQYNFNLEEYNT